MNLNALANPLDNATVPEFKAYFRGSTRRTPLIELQPGLLAKLEMENPGASHKVRAARFIVRSAIESGEIIPGKTTVIEKTGGNFGLGLILACNEFQVPVELAVGLSFSPVKRRCLESFGASLIGKEMLSQGAAPREVVEWHLAHADEIGKSYYYTDQFNNPGSVYAHELETGPEIADQLADHRGIEHLVFVACAGTGAHLTGISRALKKRGHSLEVILVEPQGCNSREGIFVDHRLEGMAVGVKPPLLDWSLVSQTLPCDHDSMLVMKWHLAAKYGYFVGNTSAACLAVAHQIRQKRDDKSAVLTIAYDHGLWYE